MQKNKDQYEKDEESAILLMDGLAWSFRFFGVIVVTWIAYEILFNR